MLTYSNTQRTQDGARRRSRAGSAGAETAAHSCPSQGVTEAKRTEVMIREECLIRIREGKQSHGCIRKERKFQDLRESRKSHGWYEAEGCPWSLSDTNTSCRWYQRSHCSPDKAVKEPVRGQGRLPGGSDPWLSSEHDLEQGSLTFWLPGATREGELSGTHTNYTNMNDS